MVSELLYELGIIGNRESAIFYFEDESGMEFNVFFGETIIGERVFDWQF